MQQADLIRVLASVATAGAGAGLALGGAAVTGHLDASTTIQQITEAPVVPQGLSASTTASAPSLSVAQIYRLDAPGVVQITAKRGAAGANGASRPLGSGFVIDKAGHIVTSNRVVADAGAGVLEVSFSGNDRLSVKMVGKDPATDVAVLQIDAHSRSLSPLPLGDSDGVQVGDPVVAIGNPFSLTRTATAGVVSAVLRTVDAPSGSSATDRAIQTDAAIGDGNVGGPLINAGGEVIGMSARPAAVDGVGGGGDPGVGFAVPINTVKGVVAQLIQYGKAEHAYLGISALPVTPSLARILALPASRGLLVQNVISGGAADNAGLRMGTSAVIVAGESYRVGGDIIVAANGEPVSTEAQLGDVVATMRPGDRLVLAVWRGSTKETLHVTLGRPPG